MKVRKICASVMVLCLILCSISVTAFAAEAESILLDETKTVSSPADQSEFTSGEVVYSFTAEESGTYVFSVFYTSSDDLMHIVVVSAGEDEASDKVFFEAAAGETVELRATYWGLYTESVDYVFCVQECVPLQGIELTAQNVTGSVEEYLYVDVNWNPSNSVPEEITWQSSDPSVAEISFVDIGFAELYLIAPGTATVTATTASGKTASIQITVEDAEALPPLNVGQNPMSVPADEAIPFSFTPEASGYYVLAADNEMVGCWLNADTVGDGTNEYYVLEAGVSYEGEVYNWSEEDVECTVTIEYCENVVIIDPVKIEIIKLPDNLTYLKDSLVEMWSDDKLSGLELKVTWSDGTVSEWSYDENYGFIGGGYVGGFLNENEDGSFEVEVYVSVGEVEPVFFDLTVLDITAESIALVDDTPLQIVEYSCGLDLSALGVGAEGWYYLPFAAYNREVVITFSDGSTVTAKPGDVVYGVEVSCQDNQGGVVMSASQPEGFWSKDSENLIGYLYGDLYAALTVEIIDSPVESIELAGVPENTFMVDEAKGLINRDGQIVETLKALLDGLALKVNYTDGTSKTFAAEDIEWRNVMEMEYPFVDGYPIGLLEGLLTQNEIPEIPGEMEMSLEYMGKTVTYTLRFVEEFETEDDSGKPDIEINPETGDDFVMLAVLVFSMMAAAVIIVKNEKLIG